MFHAVSVMALGYTRINGVVCYNNSTREFLEITPAKARELINNGKLKGLKWINGEDGPEFVCDTEGFNQLNMPIKTACGKFRPMLHDHPGYEFNTMFTLVRVVDVDECRLYEIVSNKCCRIKVKEANLRELNNITSIAGCWIHEDEIVVADGVLMVDRKTSTKEQAVEVDIENSPLVEEPLVEEIPEEELVVEAVEENPITEGIVEVAKEYVDEILDGSANTDDGSLDTEKLFTGESAENNNTAKKSNKKTKRK